MRSAEALEVGGLVAATLDRRHDVVDVGRRLSACPRPIGPLPLARWVLQKPTSPTPLPVGAVSPLRRGPAAAGQAASGPGCHARARAATRRVRLRGRARLAARWDRGLSHSAGRERGRPFTLRPIVPLPRAMQRPGRLVTRRRPQLDEDARAPGAVHQGASSLLAPEHIELEALYAAPFQNDRADRVPPRAWRRADRSIRDGLRPLPRPSGCPVLDS